MKAVLAVFLKAPRPGAVKTRLVPSLGPEAAAGLYRALAEAVVEGTRPVSGEYERMIAFAPPEAREEIAAWFPGEALCEQRGSDLGARMARAFDEMFHGGADRAAIVGSDIPGLARADVVSALAALEDHDLALGPATDGGYYLVALRGPQPRLFAGIAWGTSSVLMATLERAATLRLAVRVLDERRDVDTVEDLRAEWPRIRDRVSQREAEAVEKVLRSGPPAPRNRSSS